MHQQKIIVLTIFLITTFSAYANNSFPDELPEINVSSSAYNFERKLLQKTFARLKQNDQLYNNVQTDSKRWDQAAAHALSDVTSASSMPDLDSELPICRHLPLNSDEKNHRSDSVSYQSAPLVLDEQTQQVYTQPETVPVGQTNSAVTQAEPELKMDSQEHGPCPWSQVFKKHWRPLMGGTIVVGAVLGLVTHQ